MKTIDPAAFPMSRHRAAFGAALFICALAFPSLVQAQGAIQQLGPVVRGHMPMWIGNGQMMDGGTAANNVNPGTLPSGLGIVNPGTGICQFSGYASAAYSYLCSGFDSNGNVQFSLGNNGGGSPPSLSFLINGSSYAFPGTGNGDVAGPASSTDSRIALFNGTTGKVLKDGPAPSVTLGSTLLSLGGTTTTVAGLTLTAPTLTSPIVTGGLTTNSVILAGSTSGTLTLASASIAGSNTITLPAGTTNFSATGGTSQVVKQTSSGGAFTVARLACADLSDAAAGCSGASANPSASIGLSAVNGAATTYMRSDAAPALSQTIVPTWSGLHTFSAGLVTTTATASGRITSTISNGAQIYENSNALLANLPAWTGLFIGTGTLPALSGTGGVAECSGIQGKFNTGVGLNAGVSLTNGCGNTAVGAHALESAVSTPIDTAVGYAALQVDVGGGENTGVGYGALGKNTTGVFNTCVGGVCLQENINGSYNTAFGSHASLSAVSGDQNTHLGYDAGFSNVGGSRNVAVGAEASFSSLLNDNTAVGYSAGTNNSGAENVFIGSSSSYYTTASSHNVCIGYETCQGTGSNAGSQESVVIGHKAGLQMGANTNNNTYIGSNSGLGATGGGSNVLIGASVTSPSYNQVTTGSTNVALGYDVAIASPTNNQQLVISNYIYGTGMGGTGSTISTGKIGLGIKAPAYQLDVVGTIQGSVAMITPALTVGTIGASGQITSTVTTGSAPFVVASTTLVANLNAEKLGGATFAAPGTIGSGTPGAATFTTLQASGTTTLTSHVVTSGLSSHTGGSGGVKAACIDNATGELYKSTTADCT